MKVKITSLFSRWKITLLENIFSASVYVKVSVRYIKLVKARDREGKREFILSGCVQISYYALHQ